MALILERYLLGKTLPWSGYRKDLRSSEPILEVWSLCRCKGKHRLFTPPQGPWRGIDIFERNHSVKIFDGGVSSVLEVHVSDDTTYDFGKLQ